MSIAPMATRSAISGSRSRAPDRTLVLDPDEFYILASREAVHVPPDYAAEMMPFDPLGRRISRALCGLLRSRLRPCGGGRPWQPRRARGALARRALHPRRRANGGAPRLRAPLGKAEDPLRDRSRLALPGARPEAVEAFPGSRDAARVARQVVAPRRWLRRPWESGDRPSNRMAPQLTLRPPPS